MSAVTEVTQYQLLENSEVLELIGETCGDEYIEQSETVELVPTGEGSMMIKMDTTEIIEHVCGKCDKSYKSFSELKKHLLMCRNTPRKTDSTIKNKEEYIRHNIEHFQIMFNDVNEKEMEKEAEAMESKNMCFCCQESFETAHSGHIRCPDCPKSFKNTNSFQRHTFLLHSPSTDYHCEKCNARCRTEKFLKLHMSAHSRGKPFICQKCGKEFTRRYHLIRHQKFTNCDASTEKDKIPCKVCGKIFYRIDNLRHHLRVHLGEAPKRRDYQCPFCEMAFYGTATLNIHIRTHTGERPFSCDLCDKAFPSNPALRKHRRTHTGEKPYKCSVCSRSFAAKEVLNRHTKIHTGERPHTCNFCGKSFIQATQLKAHIFHHTGENGIKCPECDMMFNRKNKLKNHMVNEHGTKAKEQFKCKECKKNLQNQHSYDLHVQEVHGVEKVIKSEIAYNESVKTEPQPEECPLCPEIFYDSDTLLRHIRIAHGSTSENEESLPDMIDVDDKVKVLPKTPVKRKPINGKRTRVTRNGSKNKSAVDDNESAALFMHDVKLKESIGKLLNLLLDQGMLSSFGWPTAPVERVLNDIIKKCGQTPFDYKEGIDYSTKMRENVKLLFTVVIDNDSIKSLLTNHTIDEVIHQVLKMANV